MKESLEQTIKKRLQECTPVDNTPKALTPNELKRLKIQTQKYTSAMGSIKAKPVENDEDHSVLSKMLKGKYPWGDVDSTSAKAVINALRSLDPRQKLHVINKIYYDPKAFDAFFNEGVEGLESMELTETYDNISMHPTIRGSYIGYNKNGQAYSVRRDSAYPIQSQWRAVNTSTTAASASTVWAGTLKDLAAKLADTE